MSDPSVAPHPHPETIRISRTQIALAVVAILVAAGFGAVNYFKPSVLR